MGKIDDDMCHMVVMTDGFNFEHFPSNTFLKCLFSLYVDTWANTSVQSGFLGYPASERQCWRATQASQCLADLPANTAVEIRAIDLDPTIVHCVSC